jgi:hypothetical protein
MPSSNDYATPIALELAPGRMTRLWQAAALVAACAGIGLADLPPGLLAVPVLLAALTWWQESRQAPRGQLVLYVDGLVAHAVADERHPVELLDIVDFGPLRALSWRDRGGRRHDRVLFPDRLDASQRHRLAVWRATHDAGKTAEAGA